MNYDRLIEVVHPGTEGREFVYSSPGGVAINRYDPITGGVERLNHLDRLQDFADGQIEFPAMDRAGEFTNDFFDTFSNPAMLTIEFPEFTLYAATETIRAGVYKIVLLTSPQSGFAATGGEVVTVRLTQGPASFKTWGKLEQTTTSEVSSLAGKSHTKQAGILRTRFDPRITSRHQIELDGTRYSIATIQEIGRRKELRVGLVDKTLV